MPKPVVLSIVASTIAVASLAYKSTKSLIDFIDSLHDAPTLISDLRGDVQAVQNILRSIELILENRDDRQLSGDLRVCLSSAHMPVKDCQAVSEEFEKKLRDWFRDSAWDRLKANFKEAKIAKFRTRLRDTRDTLDLALNICSIKFDGIRAEEAKTFEAEMEKQVHQLSGKLQGMEIIRQEILDAAEGLSEQNHQLAFQQGELARRLLDHERVLREALKFCAAGLSETGKRTGNKVKLAKTMDEAKQIVAVFSDVTGDITGGIEIDTMNAQDKSRQVGITNNAEFALKFLE